MKFLVYSRVNRDNIATELGKPEYSYYFAMKDCLPIIQEYGEVVFVNDRDEIDRIYNECIRACEPVLALLFTAPQNTFPELRCPSIPVFAWEFKSIPTDTWSSDGNQDWRSALSRCRAAITHSSYTTAAVKAELGEDFPIISMPCPVWDKFAAMRSARGKVDPIQRYELSFDGVLFDSHDLGVAPKDTCIKQIRTAVNAADEAASLAQCARASAARIEDIRARVEQAINHVGCKLLPDEVLISRFIHSAEQRLQDATAAVAPSETATTSAAVEIARRVHSRLLELHADVSDTAGQLEQNLTAAAGHRHHIAGILEVNQTRPLVVARRDVQQSVDNIAQAYQRAIAVISQIEHHVTGLAGKVHDYECLIAAGAARENERRIAAAHLRVRELQRAVEDVVEGTDQLGRNDSLKRLLRLLQREIDTIVPLLKPLVVDSENHRHEVARYLERNPNALFRTARRDVQLSVDRCSLLLEDILKTGGTIHELIRTLEAGPSGDNRMERVKLRLLAMYREFLENTPTTKCDELPRRIAGGGDVEPTATDHVELGEAILASLDVADDSSIPDSERLLDDDLRPDSDDVAYNSVYLEGVVYTSLFNPYDGRKNWPDMLTAFVWAFKDVADATLVIKVSSGHFVQFTDAVTDYLRRLAPFRCRVAIIHAYLERKEYEKLMQGTSFYVNTSTGEGQCLPLMEFLSAGIPAIAPATTALSDYITDEIALVLETTPEPTAWQHDPRRAYRTLQDRVVWQSLHDAYRRSYELAKTDITTYQRMSDSAIEQMSKHCSRSVLQPRFASLMETDEIRQLTELPPATPQEISAPPLMTLDTKTRQVA